MKKLLMFAVVLLGVASFVAQASAEPGPYDATMAVDGYAAGEGQAANGIPTPRNSKVNPKPPLGSETPQVYEAINYVLDKAGVGSPGLTTNTGADAYAVTGPNAYWHQITLPGQSGNFAVISITAANTNTLGAFKAGDPVPAGVDFFDSIASTGFTFLGDGIGSPYPGAINPFPTDNFGFALKSTASPANGGGTNIFYSDPALNSDGLDHMLAYYLPQLATHTVKIKVDTDNDNVLDTVQDLEFSTDTYLLAWEDLPVGSSFFDSDYNDTIFLVTKVRPIPEPMTLTLLGGGLAGLAGLRRRKTA